MTERTAENDYLIDYAVWRSGPTPKARDVRLYFGLDEQGARDTLDLCNRDKAEAYPDAPIEFYAMRTTRERVALWPKGHPCGHAERTPECGGCDPGAIEFVITDDGARRPFDPTQDMSLPPGATTD